MKYLDKKYLGGDLGGGGAALDQASMVLNPEQLVLILFIGILITFLVLRLFYIIRIRVNIQNETTSNIFSITNLIESYKTISRSSSA